MNELIPKVRTPSRSLGRRTGLASAAGGTSKARARRGGGRGAAGAAGVVAAAARGRRRAAGQPAAPSPSPRPAPRRAGVLPSWVRLRAERAPEGKSRDKGKRRRSHRPSGHLLPRSGTLAGGRGRAEVRRPSLGRVGPSWAQQRRQQQRRFPPPSWRGPARLGPIPSSYSYPPEAAAIGPGPGLGNGAGLTGLSDSRDRLRAGTLLSPGTGPGHLGESVSP
ncbi:uncharacterized protein LOC114043635 [Vombatus ursinus]|uniref:uncharacterized protein LOC114043635 n=1 Tax=Vombatus ursinus TaxID=29139 RepID=UPI000FFD159E|nr:uncharacterized protein LOC114043635 [Vombatus ursinus]